MAKLELPFVQRFVDRNGHVRHYFRRRGYERAVLPGEVGSKAFMDAYQVAMGGKKSAGQERSVAGTVSALIAAYYGSTVWRELGATTQANYRNILERFRVEHGALPAAELQPRHIKAIRDKGADRPGATRNLLKRLRGVYAVGVDLELVPSNPVVGVKLPKEGDGFRAWTEEDVEKFEAKWPEGSRARLALALLLYTGQRRSDVVGMGLQHVKGGEITVIQKKGGYKVHLVIPMHPNLKRAVDALPKTNLTFIMTEYGKPMSEAGFTQWFVECAIAAGLPPRSGPHGLRKAAARRLAEAGCTPHQIASVTGHASLKEVERYTKSAGQAGLARAAMSKLSDEP
ncbi:site-specific recombinase XerD [Caulobacter sp. AP07]|uniref:tyrosine-type recombinase/integrase n=1 Tax=Caulobacter sp. AP07 TaxID=1144304 RepID=UPI000271E44A|nr:tyrosine-type recombinase/integrase [Caulobacter sp. AP07]EJL23683.1 site-specific recombinase XerD [Caulobacter sp. AP07]